MGELILVPTPISDELPLEVVAKERLLSEALKEDVVILVEEHKVARQRWLRWGLQREAIEKFILFNEHSQDKLLDEVMAFFREGKRVYLLSDCGLPAFCDPGQRLVDLCHKRGVKVTSTPFPNSIALAIALSGFNHDRFSFCGFVPVKEPERTDWMKRELKRNETLVWMETPYRLMKLIEELVKLGAQRELFLGMDLSQSSEALLRGSASTLLKKLRDGEKREFVLILGPQN